MFKVGDKVKTRDGRDVRIICVDSKSTTRPIEGLVSEDLNEGINVWMADGSF